MATPNYTAQIILLQQEIDEMKEDFSENDNAFFLCSMSLIIFRMLHYFQKKQV